MLRKIFYIIILLFTGLEGTCQKTWSLTECINYAKTNNATIVMKKLENLMVAEDLRIAKGQALPNLNFTGSQSFSLGSSFNVSTGVGQLESSFNSFSLSSSLNLYNGMRIKNDIKKNRFALEKGIADRRIIELDLSLKITNKYLQVLFGKEIVAVAREQEAISSSEVEKLKKLFLSNLKSSNEVLEMESTLALDHKEKIIALNALKKSYVELQELLGLNFDETFEIKSMDEVIADLMEIPSSQNIFIKAKKTNPTLRSIELDLEMAKKDVQIYKSLLLPKIDLFYSYSTSYYHILGIDDMVFNQETQLVERNGFLQQINNNKTHFVGISATIPIFNRFSRVSDVKKSNYRVKIEESKLLEQEKVLKNIIEVSHSDFITGKEAFKSSQTAEKYQSEAFKIMKKKYDQKLTTIYEFLESKSKYIYTKSELIKSKYDYLFKYKILEYYKTF